MIAVEWQEETKQQKEQREGVGREMKGGKWGGVCVGKKKSWETITQPDNYIFVGIFITSQKLEL